MRLCRVGKNVYRKSLRLLTKAADSSSYFALELNSNSPLLTDELSISPSLSEASVSPCLAISSCRLASLSSGGGVENAAPPADAGNGAETATEDLLLPVKQ